jgi:ubiquinone/menaquinone biosynthesis C-methylase UbiE
MPMDNDIADHYAHGSLLEAIQDAITQLGKTIDSVTIEDLAPVDEFHIGGRQATERFLAQLDFSEPGHVLDVGCGLGGAARFVADKSNNQVTGIDLTHEYIETGNVLCTWVGLGERITLQQGSALSLPFEQESFDGAYMMHVGMNIDSKAELFTEIHRVLRPQTSFGVYDVMRNNDGELTYPVPWATDSSMSKLSTPEQYEKALSDAGFEILKINNRRDFALDFFKQLRAKTEARGGPPPLGLHTLMQETTTEKIGNMVDNISRDCIAPVEVICRTPS